MKKKKTKTKPYVHSVKGTALSMFIQIRGSLLIMAEEKQTIEEITGLSALKSVWS